MAEGDETIFEFKSGIKLKLRKGNSVAVQEAQNQLAKDDPAPEPPMVMNEEKGREEPNPNDPIYRQSYTAWITRQGLATYRVLIQTSTEASHIPEGMYGPDDDDFSDWLEAMNIEASDNKFRRYIQWVMFYAAPDNEEFAELGTTLLKLAGISEEAIKEAEESFRSFTVQSAD